LDFFSGHIVTVPHRLRATPATHPTWPNTSNLGSGGRKLSSSRPPTRPPDLFASYFPLTIHSYWPPTAPPNFFFCSHVASSDPLDCSGAPATSLPRVACHSGVAIPTGASRLARPSPAASPAARSAWRHGPHRRDLLRCHSLPQRHVNYKRGLP
jgi:hypothetical protein